MKMKSLKSWSRLSLFKWVVAGLTLSTTVAHAGGGSVLSYSGSVSSGRFSASIVGMPDLDQKRAALPIAGIPGLPGNGAGYCSPVATANLLGFLDTHGFSYVLPDADFDASRWDDGSSASYGETNGLIYWMGVVMGTTVEKGTERPAVATFLRNTLNERRPPYTGNFDVKSESNLGCESDPLVSADRIYTHLSEGKLVLGEISYYREERGILIRKQGHTVTLTGVSRTSLGDVISFSDPGAVLPGDTMYQQSAFSEHTESLRTVTVDLLVGAVPCRRELLQLGEPLMSAKMVKYYRMFDGLQVITPPRPYLGSGASLPGL
jgi:hypothetical protein